MKWASTSSLVARAIPTVAVSTIDLVVSLGGSRATLSSVYSADNLVSLPHPLPPPSPPLSTSLLSSLSHPGSHIHVEQFQSSLHWLIGYPVLNQSWRGLCVTESAYREVCLSYIDIAFHISLLNHSISLSRTGAEILVWLSDSSVQMKPAAGAGGDATILVPYSHPTLPYPILLYPTPLPLPLPFPHRIFAS